MIKALVSRVISGSHYSCALWRTNPRQVTRGNCMGLPCKFRRWVISTTLALYCLPGMADQTPVPFSAEYKVTKGIMSVGTTKRRLKDEGNGNYLFESITEASGVAKLFTSGTVVERSHWHWSNNKFVPLEYEYHNSGAQKRDVKLIFDWVTMQVTNIINGEPWTMKIEENTLDKLVYQLAIMYDLSEGEDTLLYQVADGGKTKTYDIKITKEEKMAIDFGKFNTTKIVRTQKDRTITMWCAKELSYLPVKIERRTEGDTPIVAELVELKGIEFSRHIEPSPKNAAPSQPTAQTPATPSTSSVQPQTAPSAPTTPAQSAKPVEPSTTGNAPAIAPADAQAPAKPTTPAKSSPSEAKPTTTAPATTPSTQPSTAPAPTTTTPTEPPAQSPASGQQ